jgi:adenylate cyclase
MGDGTLVEFASVVDAVECAAALQRSLATHDLESANIQRIRLRIGINIGDIIVEGDDLYGDGVNIAARLESLAKPGGICISGTAFDQAVHKAGVGYEGLGEMPLKNIADPVRVYRVVLDPVAVGRIITRPRQLSIPVLSLGLAALLLVAAIAAVLFIHPGPVQAKRPSVAIMPFANLSIDPQQAYFADAITEDLITDLAKLSAVDVIARNSVFKYKDQSAAPKDIGDDLGVNLIVEGSVQRTGDQVRNSAQLINAAGGNLPWADKYDRQVADVFAIQNEVVTAIIAALGIKPTLAETHVLARLPTANLEAYDYYLRGEQAARSGARPQLRKALDFYMKAEALDPAFADALAADA